MIIHSAHEYIFLINFSALSRAIKDDTMQLAKRLAGQRSEDALTWISSLNFSTKQNDFFGRHQEGTGKWLLKADSFKNWLDGTESTLWCPGLRMIFSLNSFCTIALY
jgi:hypothetical protein